MSVQWGLWNFDETSRRQEVLKVLPRCLAQWGPDSNNRWSGVPGLTLGVRAFHVTHEDFRQIQPYESPDTGNVFTFDGRIDNRAELIGDLGFSRSRQTRITKASWNPAAISSAPFPILVTTPKSASESLIQPAHWVLPHSAAPTDLELAAAAFDRWNAACFGRLRGDWAMVVWEKQHEALWFAKDAFGPRHLHYVHTDQFVCWSTRHECLSRLIRDEHLDPATLTADPLYRAANAIALPSIDATPFSEIRSVPPAHAVLVERRGRITIMQTSVSPNPRPQKAISFEQAGKLFRVVLERSLLCRTRSAFPVTFELSGGCDSSTLVCLAHELSRRGKLPQEIYTITCDSPSELQSQDQHYARLVEEYIGRRGYHVLVRQVADDEDTKAPTPEELGAFDEISNAHLEHSDSLAMRELWSYRARYTDILRERESRLLLCGIGGDELIGGIQFAGSSLADEWAFYSIPNFFRSLQRWARYKNETVWRLLWQTAMECFPVVLSSLMDGPVRRQIAAAKAYLPGVSSSRLRMMKFAFSGSVRPWRSKRHQSDGAWPLSAVLSHKQRLNHIGCWHRAFPYIDMDWIKLASVLPPVYIQTAFHRRRLVRAAAEGVVPNVVLWRRTKDYGVMTARSAEGVSKRRLQDLEENAELLQVLQVVARFAPSGLKATPTHTNPGFLGENVAAPVSRPFANSTPSDDSSYSVAAHVRFVSDTKGATLLDTIRGKRIVLNTAGAAIWRGLADGKALGDIARELADRYDISLETALLDTQELVAGFLHNGLLEISPLQKHEESEYARTR